MLQPIATSSDKGQRVLRAVKVDAGDDRFGAALRISGWRFDCKISGKDTEGDYCVFDTIRTAKGGPPLHIHHDQDEWFYVREGEYVFKVGEETFHLKPGDSLFGPRKVPHAFASLTDRSALIVAFQPAGAMEQLFQEACRLSRSRPLTPDDWRRLGSMRGVEIVGPPLSEAELAAAAPAASGRRTRRAAGYMAAAILALAAVYIIAAHGIAAAGKAAVAESRFWQGIGFRPPPLAPEIGIVPDR